MKKQKISAVLLAGVMILGMTGCGNSKAKAYSKYVELGDYKGIEYTMSVKEVTDEDIEAELDQFVAGLTESTEVTDRAVKDGDTVHIDFVGTMDGEEFDNGSATDQELVIGSNSFIDGFETGLIGHEIGEEVSLDLEFPDPYEKNPDFSGKPVNFKVTINSITEEITPELTDDLVKENTDYDTIDAYKEYIAKDLKETRENAATQQAKSDIFNKVIENSTISGYDENEAKKLVDQEFERFKETAASYESYGYSYEDVLTMNGFDSEDSLKEGITEYIKNYLEQKMVLYCIAAKEGIKVKDDEIEERVKEYMDSYGLETEEEVYDYVGEEDYFEISILSVKVMDLLMENGVLVDSIEDDNTEEATEDETTEEETTEDEASEEESAEGETSEEETTEGETSEEETTEGETTEAE